MGRLMEMAVDERPRERMLRSGAHALEADALLALVLGTGRGSGEDALGLATRMLAELGGPEGLGRASLEQLREVRGVGPVRAARIRAAFELALRAGLGGTETSPDMPGVSPFAAHLDRLAGVLGPGRRSIAAYAPAGDAPPLVLDAAACLEVRAQVGASLAQLLAQAEVAGPWWIVSARTGGPPTPEEVGLARRLVEAASALGIELARVLLLRGRQAVDLLEVGPC